MYINKLILVITALLLILNSSFSQTNVKIDSNKVYKSFVLQVGGGVGSYTTTVAIKPNALAGSVKRFSPVGSLRLLWYPSYRLRLGFETGYTDFYSYKVKNGSKVGSVHLSAIPFLFVFSMQVVRRVNIYGGFGAFLESTHLVYDGTVVSRAAVLGSNIALSYTYPFSNSLSVVAEAEWMNAYDTKDATLNIQAKLAWRFLRWQ